MGYSKALSLALLLFLNSSALAWEAQVVGVKDGDTLVVWDGKEQTTIRLNGIDAPEHNQAFGERAKQFTSGMVFGKKVRIEGKKKDAHGRTLGEVFVDGRSVNDALVTEGLAWHYKKYSTNRNLAETEDAARALRRGLWSDSLAIPPWEFRHEKQKVSDDDSGVTSNRNKAEEDRAKKTGHVVDGDASVSVGSSTTGSQNPPTYTGSRGGRYHYSSSGKKVYEKKR